MASGTLSGARLKKVVAALEGNWKAEMEGYHTYQTMADRDTDPVRAQVLRHLASAEWEHAALWHGRIMELGGAEPVYHGKPGGEADSLASRAGGVRMALRRLEIEESRAIASYGEQLKSLGDEESIAILEHVIEDEKDHYKELGSLLRGHYPLPTGAHKIDAQAVLDEMLAKRAQGRKQPGSWIGDAIYGVNDGLGAIFGIVSGVSGATAGDSKYVLLAGLSGLIASALSMGSGAYLAAKSEREIYHAELAREREAIQMNGPEARELLSLYYQVKGLPEEDAQHMVEHIASDPEQLLRALAGERLGTSEEALVESHGLSQLRRSFDRRRRGHPHHSVFLHERPRSGYRRRHHLARRPLRRRRRQVADYCSLVVVLRPGDDRRRRSGRRSHLRHRHFAGQGRSVSSSAGRPSPYGWRATKDGCPILGAYFFLRLGWETTMLANQPTR